MMSSLSFRNMYSTLWTVYALLPWILLGFLILPGNVSCHGRLWEPPGRSTMWRRGYNTTVNTNDNQLSCGGYKNHWVSYRGRCGVCGDPYQQYPRENEYGGIYASGIITRAYPVGGTIDVTVDLTANHGGYFEFRLCPVSNIGAPASHECMARHRLAIIGAPGDGYRYPIMNRGFHGFINMSLPLPPGFYCDHCVLQWMYNTGTRWGCDPDMTCGKGRGPQEEFYGCSDIAVTNKPDIHVNYGQPNVNPAYAAKLPVAANIGPDIWADRVTNGQIISSQGNGPMIGRRQYMPVKKQILATVPQHFYSSPNPSNAPIKRQMTHPMNKGGNWLRTKPKTVNSLIRYPSSPLLPSPPKRPFQFAQQYQLKRTPNVSPNLIAHYVNKFPNPKVLYMFLKRKGIFVHPDTLQHKYNHILDSQHELRKQFHMVAKDAVTHYFLKKRGQYRQNSHSCHATEKFSHNPLIQEWCRRSCANQHSKCPPHMCVCDATITSVKNKRANMAPSLPPKRTTPHILTTRNGHYGIKPPPPVIFPKPQPLRRNIFKKTPTRTPFKKHIATTQDTRPLKPKAAVLMDKHLRVKMVDNHGFTGKLHSKSYSPLKKSVGTFVDNAIDGASTISLPNVAHVVPRKIICSASDAFSNNKHMKLWCMRNCEFGFCPVSVCSCT